VKHRWTFLILSVALIAAACATGSGSTRDPYLTRRTTVEVGERATPRPAITLKPLATPTDPAPVQPRTGGGGSGNGGGPGGSDQPPAAIARMEPVAGTSADARSLIRAFDERIRATRSFGVEVGMDLRVANERITLDMEYDVSGADYQGSFSQRSAGVELAFDMVVSEGDTYVKLAGEPWMFMPETGVAEVAPNPFALGGTLAVAYRGTEQRDGRTVHRLNFPELRDLGAALLDEYGAGLQADHSAMNVYVSDDGTPLTLTFSVDGTVTEMGIRTGLDASIEYRFARYGQPVRIDVPETFIDGGPDALEPPTG